MAYVSSAVARGTGTSATVDKPTGTTTGDIVLLMVSSEFRTVGEPSTGTWTALLNDSADDTFYTSLWWCYAEDFTDASVSVPLSGAAYNTAMTLAYTGVAPPASASAGGGTPSAGFIQSPSVPVATDDTLVVLAAAYDATSANGINTSAAAPSGMTYRTGLSPAITSCAAFDEVLTATGWTGARAVTVTATAPAHSRTVSVLLPPASSYQSSSIARVGVTAPVESTSASSVTVTKPSGVQEGDLLLAQIWQRSTGYSSGVPSGWTLLQSSMTAGAGNDRLEVYAKAAGASEPASYTWTFPAASGRYGGGIVAYRDAEVAGSSVASEPEATGLTNPDPHPAAAVTVASAVTGGRLVQMSVCTYSSAATAQDPTWAFYGVSHLWGQANGTDSKRAYAGDAVVAAGAGSYTPPQLSHQASENATATHSWVTVAVLLADTSAVAPLASGSVAASLPAVTATLAGSYTPPTISGAATASLPIPSVDLSGFYVDPGALAAGALDAALPAPTAVLAGAYTAPGGPGGHFVATLPAPTLALAGRFHARNGYGLVLDSETTVDAEAPLPATPSDTGTPALTLHVVTPTVPTPVLVNGRPS